MTSLKVIRWLIQKVSAKWSKWCILRCFTVSPWGVTWRLSTRILLRGNPGLMTTKAGRRRASKHSHSLLFFAHTQTQHFDILTSTTSPKEIMPGNYWKLKYRNPLISLLLKNIFFNHLRFFVISLFASSWLIKWINQLYLNFLELHNYFLFF